MEYNYRKFAKKTGKGFVILSEAGAKELLSNKKLNQSLKFVGNCTEAGQLESAAGDKNFLEEETGVKTETASVEDILKGKTDENPIIEEKEENNPPPPPIVEEVKEEVKTENASVVNEEVIPFSYDTKIGDDHFEDKDPDEQAQK